MAGFRFSAGARDFYFYALHRVQTVSGAHPASYTMGIWGATAGKGINRSVREADYSPLSSAEVRNGGAILPLLHTPSQRGALTT
jgi:hypothetical protein